MAAVVNCYRAGNLGLCLTNDVYKNPWAQLMAILVVVIKMIHLDAQDRSDVPIEVQPADDTQPKDGSDAAGSRWVLPNGSVCSWQLDGLMKSTESCQI